MTPRSNLFLLKEQESDRRWMVFAENQEEAFFTLEQTDPSVGNLCCEPLPRITTKVYKFLDTVEDRTEWEAEE